MSEHIFAASETANSEAEQTLGIRPYCIDNMANDPVDPEDVKKAQNGDDEAFSKLFWQTYRYVFGISRRYLKNDEDIRDAIQDTYTNIYANLKKLKAPEAFVTWVGKIAVTCSRSMAEKITATKADTLDDDELVEIDDTARDPKTEVTVDVTAVLSQMEPADVELLTYIYYDRLRVAEVARMQGVPLTTVYSRLNAAKRKLKELLKIRGIDKAVYGGDIVAVITTALRNAIGTDLLSMAVAAEILHSVVGKTTKGAAVVAAVARQQRNAAALKIASWLLASAMLVFGIVAVLFYWIDRAEAPDPEPSSGLTALTSTENSSTEADRSTVNSTSSIPTDSSVGGITNVSSNGAPSQDPLPSSNDSSVSLPPNTSSDSTTSDTTVSTGTSGEIGNTDEPNPNGGNTGSTSSSGGASSSRPSSAVSTNTSSNRPSTSSSKPSASSSAASSSKPSVSSTQSTVSQPTQDAQRWSTKEVLGGVEITGSSIQDPSGTYEIPSLIDGKPVVGISDRAFYYESDIRSVILPETLKYIGEQAFAYANNIKSIVIPGSVTEIKSNAFTECSQLADIYISSTNITIASNAFSTTYQRSVSLTLHAPASVMNATTASLYWDAAFEEWYG